MNHSDALNLLKVSEEDLSSMNIAQLKRHYRFIRSVGHPDSIRNTDKTVVMNQQEVKLAFAFIMNEIKEKNETHTTTISIIDMTTQWYFSIMMMNQQMLCSWYGFSKDISSHNKCN